MYRLDMIPHLLTVFPAMLLGAQLVLTLVLVKGEICPGQRGRIHKMLPAIGVLWLAVASIQIEAFMVVFAIFYFYSQVQTKKTRDEGPLWVLYLANGFAIAYVAIQVGEKSSLAGSISVIALILLLGSSFAHLLLTIARTRLQAFHRILPVMGVVAAMIGTMSMLAYVYALPETDIAALIQPIIISVAILLVGILVWCKHLFTASPVNKVQLSVSLILVLMSSMLANASFIV